MTRVVLLGPPGSGKGVQARALQRRWGIPHIASGDLLRAQVREKSELGARAKPFMDRGELVPDELILEAMAARLSQPDAARGYALDGFPRTLAQARALDRHLEERGQQLDAVIYLEVPEGELLRRLSGRLICPHCQAIYQLETMRPKREGICDECAQPLAQREDEGPEVVGRRLQVYAEQTQPLLGYYRERGLLHEVDGTIGVERVVEEIAELVGRAVRGAKA